MKRVKIFTVPLTSEIETLIHESDRLCADSGWKTQRYVVIKAHQIDQHKTWQTPRKLRNTVKTTCKPQGMTLTHEEFCAWLILSNDAGQEFLNSLKESKCEKGLS